MLRLENITKTYTDKWNQYKVLKGLDFEVSEGEFITIFGKSGCGKTTLLNIIGLLDSYTEGSYSIEGKEVNKQTRAQNAELRNEMFGFIFQDYHLIPEMNVLENVCMPLGYRGVPKKEREILAIEQLEKLGLKQTAKKFPSQLSGGERQRVAIARATVGTPKILLADEPTGNLDQKTGNIIIKEIADIHKHGTTVLMVTHDRSLAEYSTRIVEIEDGKLKKI